MKHLVRIIEIALPVFAVILVVSQVVVSNELAILGKRLGSLEADVRIESDMQEALDIQVASASSLLTLQDRAVTLGFTEPQAKQILILPREVPVAVRP